MLKGDGQRLTGILKEGEEAGLQKQLISKHDICPRLNFNSSYLKALGNGSGDDQGQVRIYRD